MRSFPLRCGGGGGGGILELGWVDFGGFDGFGMIDWMEYLSTYLNQHRPESVI